MAESVTLDASLRERWHRKGDGWASTLGDGWNQGRSIFGGYTTAVIAALGHRVVETEDRRLRTASIQLLAPTKPGAVQGDATVVREGRNVSFVEARLAQADRTVVTANLIFAKPRETELAAPTASPPQIPAIDSLRDMPYLPGVMPEFTQHVQMRFAAGDPPYTKSDRAHFVGVFRYRNPVGDAEGVLALLDTWPCPSLSLLRSPAAASTVSWTAHLVGAPTSFDGWFTMEYETLAGNAGFHTCAGRLWGPNGALVGWSEQLVAIFD